MATLFGIAVTIVILGVLWFYVARPILEDFGIISPRAVSYYQVDEPATVRVMSREEPPAGAALSVQYERQRLDQFPLPSGEEPETNGSGTAPELYLNASEVTALHRMIDHNKTAAKPSKSSTIQAGFGVSRGGSAAYTRASLIYDIFFGPPAPAVKYRQITPEQEALRNQLKLN